MTNWKIYESFCCYFLYLAILMYGLWLAETEIKRPTMSSFLSEKGISGSLFLMGEVIFIARPLVYVLLIRKYGVKSWLPWLVSLSIDIIGMTSSIACQKDPKLPLSDPEKDEVNISLKFLCSLL